MIPQINAVTGRDFSVRCPEEDMITETRQYANGRTRKVKVPVFIPGVAFRTRLIPVRYRQSRTDKDYIPSEDVLYASNDLKYHEGNLVNFDFSKSGGAYLTISDNTRLKISERTPEGFVKLQAQFRSVKKETLTFLEINGVTIIKDGELIENPKPNRKFVTQQAWEIQKETGCTWKDAMRRAWNLAKVHTG